MGDFVVFVGKKGAQTQVCSSRPEGSVSLLECCVYWICSQLTHLHASNPPPPILIATNFQELSMPAIGLHSLICWVPITNLSGHSYYDPFFQIRKLKARDITPNKWESWYLNWGLQGPRAHALNHSLKWIQLPVLTITRTTHSCIYTSMDSTHAFIHSTHA